jgi:predicted P-loop ATPase
MLKRYYDQLDQNGYTITPCEGKKPSLKAWTKLSNKISWKTVHGDKNVGILLGKNLVAIDVDVYDVHASDAIAEYFKKMFGDKTLQRIGKYPKHLFLCKSSNTNIIPKKVKIHLTPPQNIDGSHVIEILVENHQFIAYGTHPVTNSAYEWVSEKNPENTPVNELHEFSLDDLTSFIEDLKIILPPGWKIEYVTGHDKNAANDQTMPKNMQQNDCHPSKADVIERLNKINPDAEYNEWLKIGMALHHFDSDDGLSMWDKWSSQGSKYKRDECEDKWKTFKSGRSNSVTIAYIIDLTKTHSQGNSHLAQIVPMDQRIPDFVDNCPDSYENKGVTWALSTWKNLDYLLKRYDITCVYDEILKEQKIKFSNDTDTGHSDLKSEAYLANIRSLCNLNQLPKSSTDYLTMLFDKNIVNPVMDWIELKDWDGTDRIKELVNSIELNNADDFDYAVEIITLWLIQCFAALDGAERSPIPYKIPKYELCLVFTGSQGAKKTSWFKSLLPNELEQYYKEGVTINIGDRDSEKTAISGWIVELGEIDSTFKKSAISELKAFFSRRFDDIRLPYGRTSSAFKRRTSFCGSVNDVNFLHDTTGNRRYLPLQVEKCNYRHQVEIQQLWAQIRHLYLNGTQWWATDEQDMLFNKMQGCHQVSSYVIESIEEAFDLEKSTKIRGEFMTLTKILQVCGIDKPTKTQMNEASTYLHKCGIDRIKNSSWGYYICHCQ